jgi:hypothetical protein
MIMIAGQKNCKIVQEEQTLSFIIGHVHENHCGVKSDNPIHSKINKKGEEGGSRRSTERTRGASRYRSKRRGRSTLPVTAGRGRMVLFLAVASAKRWLQQPAGSIDIGTLINVSQAADHDISSVLDTIAARNPAGRTVVFPRPAMSSVEAHMGAYVIFWRVLKWT